MDGKISKNKSTPQENSWSNPCAAFMRWDSLDSFILALTFIWAGILFLSENLGFAIDVWSLIFLGAGILVLIEVTIRMLIPAFRTSVIGDLIWAGILFWLGDWIFMFPVFLLALGGYIIYKTYSHNHLQGES